MGPAGLRRPRPLAYIKAFRSYVNFGFWRGVEIDGGRDYLTTSGEKMAHVKLWHVDEINAKVLQGYVEQAVKLNRAKGNPNKKR